MMRRRSFTLIEVLIAIALTVALVGSMFGFLFNLLSSRSKVIESIRQEDAASALITWLEADLMASIAGDSRHGPGIKGEETQLRILTRSVLTTLASQGAHQPNLLSDLQFAEYRFDESGKRIEGRRGPAGQSQSSSASSFSTIPGVIHKLRFRYYDGKEWFEVFDSMQRKSLPAAVEISIWLHPWPGEEETELPAPTSLPEELSDHERQEFAGGFDEHEFAIRSDMDVEQVPKPDRVRVILIPDASVQSESEDSTPMDEAVRS